MCERTLFRQVLACLLIGAGLMVTAEAQQIYPYLGGPGTGTYLGFDPFYYGPYGYNPNFFYGTIPQPPIGSYLPYQPQPVPPFVIPPSGLVLQPYPYFYQPPLYSPQVYTWQYYPARPTPPSYYYYPRRFTYPRSIRPQSRRYGSAARPRQNVAPVGSEARPEGYVRPLEGTSNTVASLRNTP